MIITYNYVGYTLQVRVPMLGSSMRLWHEARCHPKFHDCENTANVYLDRCPDNIQGGLGMVEMSAFATPTLVATFRDPYP